MKRFQAFRRRSHARGYLPADAAAWRRLVKEARYIVRAPLADASRLHRAGQKCFRAALPPGYAHRDSIFVQLSMKARAFWSLDQSARPGAAPEIGRLADICEAALDSPSGAPPPRRADLFG